MSANARSVSRHVMGTGEIAGRLGVVRQRVHQIVAQPDFPEPWDQISCGRLWLRTDVEAWIARHRPQRVDVKK